MTQAKDNTKTATAPANASKASNSVNRRFTTAPMMDECRAINKTL
jgi:hypothetical protein